MNITPLDYGQYLIAILVSAFVVLLSIPILLILKTWVYGTTAKKMHKARRKRRRAKECDKIPCEKKPPFFILERQKIRAPNRYVVYYYGYSLIVIVQNNVSVAETAQSSSGCRSVDSLLQGSA